MKAGALIGLILGAIIVVFCLSIIPSVKRMVEVRASLAPIETVR